MKNLLLFTLAPLLCIACRTTHDDSATTAPRITQSQATSEGRAEALADMPLGEVSLEESNAKLENARNTMRGADLEIPSAAERKAEADAQYERIKADLAGIDPQATQATTEAIADPLVETAERATGEVAGELSGERAVEISIDDPSIDAAVASKVESTIEAAGDQLQVDGETIAAQASESQAELENEITRGLKKDLDNARETVEQPLAGKAAEKAAEKTAEKTAEQTTPKIEAKGKAAVESKGWTEPKANDEALEAARPTDATVRESAMNAKELVQAGRVQVDSTEAATIEEVVEAEEFMRAGAESANWQAPEQPIVIEAKKDAETIQGIPSVPEGTLQGEAIEKEVQATLQEFEQAVGATEAQSQKAAAAVAQPVVALADLTDAKVIEARMLEVATPGEEHQWLDQLKGQWNAKVTTWIMPDADPVLSSGKMTNSWALGNRFLQTDYAGVLMGKEFQGFGHIGFDKVRKRYVGYWVDSMGTQMMNVSTGVLSNDRKSLTLRRSALEPLTGKEREVKEILTIKSANEHHWQMWGYAPDGTFFRMVEVIYTRK